MFKKLLFVFALVAFPVAYLFAMQVNPPVPEPDEVFSEIFLLYAAVLMGTVGGYSKFAKNVLEGFFGELSAKLALGLTLVIGIGFGYVQYNSLLGLIESLVIGLVAGGLAAAMFGATKQARRLPIGPTESLKK